MDWFLVTVFDIGSSDPAARQSGSILCLPPHATDVPATPFAYFRRFRHSRHFKTDRGDDIGRGDMKTDAWYGRSIRTGRQDASCLPVQMLRRYLWRRKPRRTCLDGALIGSQVLRSNRRWRETASCKPLA